MNFYDSAVTQFAVARQQKEVLLKCYFFSLQWLAIQAWCNSYAGIGWLKYTANTISQYLQMATLGDVTLRTGESHVSMFVRNSRIVCTVVMLFIIQLKSLVTPSFIRFCFLFGRNSPQWARASSSRFLDHTWRTTVGRTYLDKWSARSRDLYLTTYNSHNRQTSMHPVGFEPTISASERPQSYALDRAATEIGWIFLVAIFEFLSPRIFQQTQTFDRFRLRQITASKLLNPRTQWRDVVTSYSFVRPQQKSQN